MRPRSPVVYIKRGDDGHTASNEDITERMCEQVAAAAGTLKSLDVGPVVAAEGTCVVFRERIKLGHFISASAGERSAESGAEPARPSVRSTSSNAIWTSDSDLETQRFAQRGNGGQPGDANGAVRCAGGPRSTPSCIATVLIPGVWHWGHFVEQDRQCGRNQGLRQLEALAFNPRNNYLYAQ